MPVVGEWVDGRMDGCKVGGSKASRSLYFRQLETDSVSDLVAFHSLCLLIPSFLALHLSLFSITVFLKTLVFHLLVSVEESWTGMRRRCEGFTVTRPCFIPAHGQPARPQPSPPPIVG